MSERTTRVGGSRFLYEPFDANTARIEAQEQVNLERWGSLERRLSRIEELLDRVERRMWLAVTGMAGFLAAQVAYSLLMNSQ
ncbi:GTA head formation protein, RCAP_rcc01685 family [Oceanibium sediminis]|uniref:GTA head formation protein, RCAP_rcc01685 family n=1 Tax=Oceanibium sediminis TaxID=2026339 RepID=UPI000DD4D22E|nr:hypothetical protein [Oceanibium sediminis]